MLFSQTIKTIYNTKHIYYITDTRLLNITLEFYMLSKISISRPGDGHHLDENIPEFDVS